MVSEELKVPKYRRHASGKAVVWLYGKDHYLGKFNSAESRRAYRRLVAEFVASGGVKPVKPKSDLTVGEVILRFWTHAKGYYQKNGKPTSTLDGIRRSLKPVRELYGDQPAAEFGPLALKAVRVEMLKDGALNRSTINKRIRVVVQMFKWAAGEQLLGAEQHLALASVGGLKKGRCTAREPREILPVDDRVVESTLPGLQPTVAAMVRLQRLTGARPEEVCMIRPVDVDTTSEVWQYVPQTHKTEHAGRRRVIYIGPRAQDVLRPFMVRRKTSYCFAPAESIREFCATKRERRQTPMTPSQEARRPKRSPKRAPGNRYTTRSYGRAITRAVDKVNRDRQKHAHPGEQVERLPRWAPNQLRHAAATVIRHQYGLEGAQVALGHATANVTQIYAERDEGLAVEIMRRIG